MTIVVGGSITTYTPPDSSMSKVYYATNLNPNTKIDSSLQVEQMKVAVLRQNPENRNVTGVFPVAAMTPTTLGLAGAPVVGAVLAPNAAEVFRTAGSQINKLY